jgi:hypothetical protein
MAKMVFTLGAETFTWIANRTYPIEDAIEVNVVVDYSEGRQLYAYDKGVVEQSIVLHFDRIGATDYGNFIDWLENVAVGPTNTFTFTDEDEDDHTVRLMDTKDPFQLQYITTSGVYQYTGTVNLREEID